MCCCMFAQRALLTQREQELMSGMAALQYLGAGPMVACGSMYFSSAGDAAGNPAASTSPNEASNSILLHRKVCQAVTVHLMALLSATALL